MTNNPLFDASYDRLFGSDVTLSNAADAFFEDFYRRFLAAPDVGALFRNTDMARQVTMLRKSFFQLVGFYITSAPTAELERIATIHDRLGVSGGHFDRWLDALVETVVANDPECDLATEMAWRWAMAPGLTFLKLHAGLHRSSVS
ncbi:MAG: globin [Pseudomonadales bacterium]